MENRNTAKVPGKLHNLLQFCIHNRNKIFFVQCFLVHFAYAVFMMSVAIYTLALLNFLSSLMYILFLKIFKKETEVGMAFAYLEIICFCIGSELCLGSGYGFYLFAVGMISSLFFLIPSFGKKRFVFQIIGMVVILTVEILIRIVNFTIPIWIDAIRDDRQFILVINLAISMMLVVQIGILYATENDQIRERLRYNMNHDALTKLYNRRFFEEWAHESKILNKKIYTIAMMDIDDFKKVNDTYGHEAGDVVIGKVAEEILKLTDTCNDELSKERLKTEQVVPVRWGGEEFIVLFPGKDLSQVVPVLNDFKSRISEIVVNHGSSDITVSLTIGVASGEIGSNYEKVISRADDYLYEGKRNGKNCIVTKDELQM